MLFKPLFLNGRKGFGFQNLLPFRRLFSGLNQLGEPVHLHQLSHTLLPCNQGLGIRLVKAGAKTLPPVAAPQRNFPLSPAHSIQI